MSKLKTAGKLWAVCRRIKAQRGGSLLWYFKDAVHCSKVHGASPENYFVLRFFELDDEERAAFLTSGRSKAADRALNKNALAEDKRKVGQKQLFNKAFKGLVKRDFLYLPEAEREDYEAFLERHESFIVKPVSGTMGRGIEKLRAGELDRAGLYARGREEKLLLEEAIKQHEVLDGINPSCVNTVRINAARDIQGRVQLIGGCLKCGGAGAVTDNFHTGGVAYPLDMERGRVAGPGRNNVELKEHINHNGGTHMPGLQLPYWEEVLRLVEEAMDRAPSLAYVGWDIAITGEGPELIEGNYSWPGGNIIQFDGVGKYPLILKCLGEEI